MSRHEYTLASLRELLESAERHHTSYRRALDGGEESDAYRHLTHTEQALDRLSVGADAVRAPMVEALVARQTDQADALNGVWDAAVGDREYGFDPDATPGGAA